MELLWLTIFAFLAGFVDSIVGGGGLIQVPALFIFLPPALGAQTAAVLGTNKIASICGTSMAVAQYARHVKLDFRMLIPAAVSAFLFSFLGARAVTLLKPAVLKPLILILLAAVAIYTFVRKDFGKLQGLAPPPSVQFWLGILAGGIIGFYDGFFGPGTGSFLIFAFVGLFGMQFLQASASAKVVNWATNLAAVIYFAATGNIFYEYGLPMAAASIAGALLGSRLAILKGSAFVRRFFLAVVLLLILRLGYEMLLMPKPK